MIDIPAELRKPLSEQTVVPVLTLRRMAADRITELESALYSAVAVLNQIPNTRVRIGEHKDTYALASYIDGLLK